MRRCLTTRYVCCCCWDCPSDPVQKHLVEMGDAIGARLEYFKELESATKMLNLPGEALVLEDDFLNMLDRLDVCLEFLKINVRPVAPI